MRAGKKTLAMAIALSVVLMAPTALAGGAQVTKGSFDTFADGPGLGYEIDGKAHMVRTADGKTLVTVNVSGLTPGETYGSHVHNQACANGNAGGHYRFDAPVAGGDLDGHEIWPGPFTANGAGNAHGKAAVEASAAADAVSAAVLSVTSVVPLAGEILILTGVGLAWWLVPRFWRSVLFGAIAGVVSGILVLGVGLRVAMRVVAILDPFRVPEFTFGGTMFILIGIGGIFGGILGILTNLARRGFRLRSVFTAAVLPAAGAMSLLFVDDEIRRELSELGGGAWLNIPMFGLVTVLYGTAVAATVIGLEDRSAAKRAVIPEVEVPA